ncbi:molybdopterin-dependent oxidoreductase [Chloroflexota bacterium]
MNAEKPLKPGSEEKTVMAAHCSHCGGVCLLKVHLKNGVITRIETDDGEEPQYRACARGRAYRQRVYAPDRILYPLKRVGERGAGRFEQISWDEALTTVAGELARVKATYGPESILFLHSAGDGGRLQGYRPHNRLLNMYGGCSEVWGVPSAEGSIFSQIATFGTASTSNSRDDLLNSRFIVLWGFNPTDTVLLTNTAYWLTRAKEAGTRIVSIDPRYTNTSACCANEWIPIRPGTDTAMLIAMAYVMIDQNLYDRKFLDSYTVGFDKFRDYVMGAEDGMLKTPQWAEGITGVRAATIQNLARAYATTKPAALLAGISPGRTAFGEQYHRATATLSAMTGNIGVRGGDVGASAFAGMSGPSDYIKLGPGIPVPTNPVEAKTPPRKNSLPSWGDYALKRRGHVHHTEVADAILKGKAGGYPADYRLFYLVNTNYVNQHLNTNRCVAAMKAKTLDFTVVFEQFMTPVARYADIIMPVNTCLERNDINIAGSMGFSGFMARTIDSLGESKSHFEICVALAEKLGIPGFSDKTEEEWLRQMVTSSPDVFDYETFKKAGGHKSRSNEPHVAFKAQIEDPANNPFPTPSGKIEIYCQRLADMNDPLIPPVPKYIEPWESRNDPLFEKYPLQLITSHLWRRAHSQYDNIPWLRSLAPQSVLMNTKDAAARGIKNGDMTRIFNDRGGTRIPVRVTEGIMPGVVDIPEGAWYDPDEKGVDQGGCANILTNDRKSLSGVVPTNTALVEVEKAHDEKGRIDV